MNALKVITLAAVAACGSTNLVAYNGLNHLGYNGLHGYNSLHGYSGLHGYNSLNGYNTAAPVAYSAAVAPAYNNYVAPYAAPYAPIQSQYHSQDELGQYSFGYSGGPSNRAETRDAYGNVRGSYNYIDSNGQTQTQHYVADALGFRVSGTNLPVGPSAPAVLALAGPEPVQDTPEVAAAKVEFQTAYNAAAAAAAAAPGDRKKRQAPEPVQDTAEVAQAKAEFQAAYATAAAAAEAAPDKGPLEDYAPVYHHHGYAGLHHGYAGINHGYAGLHHGYAPRLGLHHTGYSGHLNGYAGIHHGLTHHGLHHGLTHHALPYAHSHPSRAFSYAHGLTVPSAVHAH